MNQNIFFFNPYFSSEQEEKFLIEKSFVPKNGLEAWINQTYFLLKYNYGFQALQLVNHIPREGIIIFHSGYCDKDLKPNLNQLFICIAADYGRHRFAQVHVYQNHQQLDYRVKNIRVHLDKFFPFSSCFVINHWPQSNIHGRSQTRDVNLKKIGFFGLENNLDFSIRSKFFSNLLSQLKIDFEIVSDYQKWHDYESFDLMISIRDFDGNPHFNKPFSKIVNAIIAGVPVIAGAESSSFYFKKNYYLGLPIVRTYKEFEVAIIEISENYNSYLASIEPVSILLNEMYIRETVSSWENLFVQASFLKRILGETPNYQFDTFLNYRQF